MNTEATQSTALYDLLAWLEVNKTRLVVAVVLVLVLSGGWSVANWRKSQKEVAASEALSALTLKAGVNERAPDPSAEDYFKIARAYPGTRAGEYAELLADSALFAEKRYAEARAGFDKFMHEHDSSPLAAAAALGVASALEALDKTDEALFAYQGVISRYPGNEVAGQARLAVARIFESKNQPEQALKFYQDMVRPGTPSVWAPEAGRRRDQLLRNHPSLAPTNEAAATSATVPLPAPAPPQP